MGAHHHPGSTAEPPRRLRFVVGLIAAAAFVASLGAAAWWWPGDVEGVRGLAAEQLDARVAAVNDCPADQAAFDERGEPVPCSVLSVELLEGVDLGQTFDLPAIYDQRDAFEVGETLAVNKIEAEEAPFAYSFADRRRGTALVVLAGLFAGAVVALGRLRGLLALAGLALVSAVLLVFTLPALVNGTDPLGVAVVSAALITFAALYPAHGFNAMTTTAVLGTLGALAVTVGLGQLFVTAGSFSGFTTEEAFWLDAASGSIDVRGLLLAGLVLGALGALDDMTVTQASVVFELRAADPTMSRARLFASAMKVGRDHVASTVNTLFLAYAGASLPLLLLLVLGGLPLADSLNSEIIATEVVRTLVGSIGLVVSVPLTTWLAVAVLPAGGAVAAAAASTPETEPGAVRADADGPQEPRSLRDRLRAELEE